METFETTLTGSDGPIDGVVTQLSKNAYQFSSIDGALELTVTKNADGRWIRLSGSEPYFSGWVDELVERVNAQPVIVPAKAEQQAPSTAKKGTAKPAAKKEAKKTAAKKITVKTDTTKKAKVSSGSTKTN